MNEDTYRDKLNDLQLEVEALRAKLKEAQTGDTISRQAVKLKPCPFCGSEAIYETFSQEYALGTKNPEIFCNSCKAIFSVEDSSPFLNCDEDYKYRKRITAEAWNRRAYE